MVQINIALNQEEILQLLSKDRSDAFRILLQQTLNAILRRESEEQLCVCPMSARICVPTVVMAQNSEL